MELCFLAKLVIILSLFGIILSNIIFEISIIGIIINIFFTALFVLLTNWGCNTEGYYWVAIVITIIHAIGLVASIFIVSNKNNNTDISNNR